VTSQHSKSLDAATDGGGTAVAVKLNGNDVHFEFCEVQGDITSDSATDLILESTYVDGDVTGVAGGTLELRGNCTITGTVSGWDSVQRHIDVVPIVCHNDAVVCHDDEVVTLMG
jgi:hypothetical protein